MALYLRWVLMPGYLFRVIKAKLFLLGYKRRVIHSGLFTPGYLR